MVSDSLTCCFQAWCTENYRLFDNLVYDLADYEELGNTINNVQNVFRNVGYRELLIPDNKWEDHEHRPKIVHHLIVGTKTRTMLA